MSSTHDTVAVIDFGSQYSHLIVRKLRELGAYAELLPPDRTASQLQNYKAIILSGGPQNLSASDALRIDTNVFELGVPILGICYGMQLMAYELGGKVQKGTKAEYGSTEVTVQRDGLFKGLRAKQMTWMSHGDHVSRMPKGFVRMARSSNCPIVAMQHTARQFYALQFHPEVLHTTKGKKMLDNFLKIAGVRKGWTMKHFARDAVSGIRQTIGSGKAVCALSGGVDSAIAATLVHRAIGARLTCIFVNTGLMREGEVAMIKKNLGTQLKLKLKVVDAEKEFLKVLKGVSDPEAKRKAIGGLFIRIFEREAKKLKQVNFLVQGTLYTDVVSSGISAGGKHTAVIKSHHNVGGLPEKMGFKLVEPLRDLYKYEVRKVGDVLGLPKIVTYRMPFPGPGLAVRIIGEVTSEKLAVLRRVDTIVTEEMNKTKFVKNPHFFYFAALPDTRSVGVQGDQRTYGRTIVLRAVETAEFLTADWVPLPHALLEKISTRITNEVPGITRVVYDITSKPPATVEWE